VNVSYFFKLFYSRQRQGERGNMKIQRPQYVFLPKSKQTQQKLLWPTHREKERRVCITFSSWSTGKHFVVCYGLFHLHLDYISCRKILHFNEKHLFDLKISAIEWMLMLEGVWRVCHVQWFETKRRCPLWWQHQTKLLERGWALNWVHLGRLLV